MTIFTIKKYLQERFENIDFLESETVAEQRYRNSSTILFIIGDNRILKFISYERKSVVEIEEAKKKQQKEVDILQSLSHHTNIINVYKLLELSRKGEKIGLYIEFERLACTLQDLLLKEHIFMDLDVKKFLEQMDAALQALHFNGRRTIIHSDIKPSNMGIRLSGNNNWEYVLMDFGVSVVLSGYSESKNYSVQGLTPAYSAPEHIRAYNSSSGLITPKTDIYSVGVIAIEMLTGAPPKKDENSLYYQIPLGAIPSYWKKTFNKLCDPNPEKRVTRINQALENLIINDFTMPSTVQLNKKPVKIIWKNLENRLEPFFQFKYVSISVMILLAFGSIYGWVGFWGNSPDYGIRANFQNYDEENLTAETQKDLDKSIIDDRDNTSLDTSEPGSDVWMSTESGLQYRIENYGWGKSPEPNSYIKFHYTFYSPGGNIIQSSGNGTPVEMQLNSLNENFPGITDGMILMNEGASFQFLFKESSINQYPDFIFEIELLEVM